MRRQALLPVLGIALLACSGGSVTPAPPTATLTPEPTATVQPKSEVPCQDLPTISLHYEDQLQSGQRVTLNWGSPDCAASAHAFLTVVVPTVVLELPAGASPVLEFSVLPLTANAHIRELSLAKATAVDGNLEMLVEDFHASPAESVGIDTVSEQILVLPFTAPGDYIIGVGAEWEDGRMTFQFRIEIVTAPVP